MGLFVARVSLPGRYSRIQVVARHQVSSSRRRRFGGLIFRCVEIPEAFDDAVFRESARQFGQVVIETVWRNIEARISSMAHGGVVIMIREYDFVNSHAFDLARL